MLLQFLNKLLREATYATTIFTKGAVLSIASDCLLLSSPFVRNKSDNYAISDDF
jgi:hypothetical protein